MDNLLNFSSMCRICMKPIENATNIFITEFQTRVLSNIIMECAPIQIEDNDHLPQSICSACLEKVQLFFNFRTLCIETDQKLRKILTETKELKLIKDEPIESLEEENPGCRRTSITIEENNEASLKTSVESIKSEEIVAESNPDDTTGTLVDPIETYQNYPRGEFDLVHCKYCGNHYKDVRDLKRHVKLCLRRQQKFKESLKNDIEKKIVLPPKIIIKTYDPNKLDFKIDDEGFFICPDCGNKYNDKYKILRHWREHKKIKIKCPECDRSFLRLSRLRDHIRIHTKETFCTCEFCGKCFRHRNALHKHHKIHTGIKPYTCTECNRSFTQNKSLKNHLRTHTGERPFVCETCGKNFNQYAILSRHRKIHLGVKPYTCTECNRSFTQNKSLKNHMRTHTGERPFVCDICGKDFNQRHILKTHLMTHTDERRFECNLCQKKFTRKSHLTLHITKHNKVIENVKNDT